MKLENINSIKVSKNVFPFLQKCGTYCVDYTDEDGLSLVTLTDDLELITEDIEDNFGEQDAKKT